MLSSSTDIRIIAQYDTGLSLREGLKQQQPDVLLLDIHFPDTTGNELVRELAPAYPGMKILALTSVDNPFEVQDMMQHGCSGYVQKTIASETLLQAIQTVHRGEQFLEPALKEALVQAMLLPGHKNMKNMKLTAREQEILELICDGMTNIDIGQKLFLSNRTIENYRQVLYQKFGVNNATKLVKMAFQHHFVK